MKKLFPLFLLLILTGAGCAGGTATVTKNQTAEFSKRLMLVRHGFLHLSFQPQKESEH